MIPKIKYKTNPTLTQIFLPPRGDVKKFKGNAKEFVKHFNKIENGVLENIEKFSGFKWTKKKIPVYLIPQGQIYSFAKSNMTKKDPGIILKIYETLERTTGIFIHELTHINQFQSDFNNSKRNKFVFDEKGKKNYRNIEICSDVLAIYVMKKLFGKNSSYEKDYWHFQKNIRTSEKGMVEPLKKHIKKWNLNKNPLREYIFKK